MICIDESVCVGCSQCVDICPGNLLKLKNGTAFCREVRDCWGCTACVKVCPVNAISYQLSANLGGAGAKLFAKDSPTKLTWQILKPDGKLISLEVDKTHANKF